MITICYCKFFFFFTHRHYYYVHVKRFVCVRYRDRGPSEEEIPDRNNPQNSVPSPFSGRAFLLHLLSFRIIHNIIIVIIIMMTTIIIIRIILCQYVYYVLAELFLSRSTHHIPSFPGTFVSLFTTSLRHVRRIIGYRSGLWE